MQEVTMNEFAIRLASFVNGATPVAVTSDGKTVGYFFPVQGPSDEARADLKAAGDRMDAVIEENNIDIEEVIAEFDALRKASNASKRRAVKSA